MATKQGWVIGDTAFIPDEGGSSGGGLPEVTSADNGKVLTVVEGEWNAADSGVLHVTANNGTLDKTWQEIYNAGFSVLMDETGSHYSQLHCYDDHDGAYVVIYWSFEWEDPAVYSTDSPSGYPVI